MPDFAEIRLTNDTSVRLELTPSEHTDNADPFSPPVRPEQPDGADLPDGFGGVSPVGRRSVTTVAADSLRVVLRPLGPLLQEVYDAVAATPNRPQQVNVTFGVQIGQDLKLGIVGASGQASLTVSATWELPPTGPRTGSGGA
ncbi:hypothetical protein AQ490_01255 [Wenjunlia vitaminophila]|uniref:Trypsin-co-occurring domain-containing protein n=1 Tax=Wenjunlia vitaminophila TaxID=76728 RepID=A0A0T6LZK1_WENVI|nr:CU044_2847 family protein [Wenjunlia vitaminophila]KRV51414.1 hypothetical protein AQ490_01255 [Wenjunlia vitaminophila]